MTQASNDDTIKVQTTIGFLQWKSYTQRFYYIYNWTRRVNYYDLTVDLTKGLMRDEM